MVVPIFANADSAVASMSPNRVHHHQEFVAEFATTSGMTNASIFASASAVTGMLAASTISLALTWCALSLSIA